MGKYRTGRVISPFRKETPDARLADARLMTLVGKMKIFDFPEVNVSSFCHTIETSDARLTDARLIRWVKCLNG